MYDELTGYEEHQDHVAGYQNEFQAAYSLSCLTQEYPREQRKVDAVVAAGRHAVVLTYPVYCVHTDAQLPVGATVLVSDHATREEALTALPEYEEGSEASYHVEPRPARVPVPFSDVVLASDDDIPF